MYVVPSGNKGEYIFLFLMLHSAISFIQQIFIELLLYAKHCSRSWDPVKIPAPRERAV